MKHTLALTLAILFAGIAFSEAQQSSVRATLQARKMLIAWRPLSAVVPIAALNLKRTQVYALTLKLDATSTDLSLFFGADGNRNFAHYAAIMYIGTPSRKTGAAYLYLTELVERDCLGLTETDIERGRALMDSVFSKLKRTRVTEQARQGAVVMEATAAFVPQGLSAVMTLIRTDAPGRTWATYCNFEK